jgi:hypothetical protein
VALYNGKRKRGGGKHVKALYDDHYRFIIHVQQGNQEETRQHMGTASMEVQRDGHSTAGRRQKKTDEHMEPALHFHTTGLRQPTSA